MYCFPPYNAIILCYAVFNIAAWVKILRYADKYKPTAHAVGNISQPSTVSGFAKLSDAAINAIAADKNGYFYFKLQDAGDEDQPIMLVRTKAQFNDTAVGFGWEDNYDLCNKPDVDTCGWKHADVRGKYFESEEAFGNNCKRWFADYSRGRVSGTVNCFEVSNEHRCFSKGWACNHDVRTHVTMYKWSPQEIAEGTGSLPHVCTCARVYAFMYVTSIPSHINCSGTMPTEILPSNQEE